MGFTKPDSGILHTINWLNLVDLIEHALPR